MLKTPTKLHGGMSLDPNVISTVQAFDEKDDPERKLEFDMLLSFQKSEEGNVLVRIEAEVPNSNEGKALERSPDADVTRNASYTEALEHKQEMALNPEQKRTSKSKAETTAAQAAAAQPSGCQQQGDNHLFMQIMTIVLHLDHHFPHW
jgi:hypothetical protein